MAKLIKLDDPGITWADKKAAVDSLDSGTLVNGPKSREMEAALSKVTNRDYAVTTNSGTSALLASLAALGVGPGSRVVVPSFTFPAPAAAAAFLGAEVAVCDVDPMTFCLSPQTVMDALDDPVSLVIAVDQFGYPAPVPELEALLLERGIPILVDAACSIGSRLDERPCGSMGGIAVFSFHPRKIVTSGEGGAVLTDDANLARKVRQVVNHGLGADGFESMGINLRMAETAAAVGLSQLSRLDSIIETRKEHAAPYYELPLQFQQLPSTGRFNYQTVAALLPPDVNATKRDALIASLQKNNIEANIAGYCLGAIPEVAKRLKIDSSKTPNALALHQRGISLPLHTKMEQGDTKRVAKHVSTWLGENGIK